MWCQNQVQNLSPNFFGPQHNHFVPKGLTVTAVLSLWPGFWTWCPNMINWSPFMQTARGEIIKFDFSTSVWFKKHATCQYFPILAKMGSLSDVDTEIPNLKSDLRPNTYGESFDTHHDLFVPQGPKWRQFYLFDPGFGHDARMKTFGHPSHVQRQVQKILKFGFCTSGRFERYATCNNFTLLAKLGTLWTIIRHYGPRELPNHNLDVRFLCRIFRRFSWYPSWPICANGPKITTVFCLWPGFWTRCPGNSWIYYGLSTHNWLRTQSWWPCVLVVCAKSKILWNLGWASQDVSNDVTCRGVPTMTYVASNVAPMFRHPVTPGRPHPTCDARTRAENFP